MPRNAWNARKKSGQLEMLEDLLTPQQIGEILEIIESKSSPIKLLCFLFMVS